MAESNPILLVNPPQYVYRGGHGFNVYVPLSLIHLASAIQDICDVEIYDALVEQTKPIDDVEGFRVWAGATPTAIRNRLSIRDYNLIGISAQFSSQLDIALLTARLARETQPQTTVVLGGAAATAHAGEILVQEPSVDVIVIGEGEPTLRRLIDSRNRESWRNIPNISFRNQYGTVVFTNKAHPPEDLDAFGQLPYELLDISKYINNINLYRNRSSIAKRSISVVTSRGCPYSCSFCSIHVHMTRRYRTHSTHFVISNLKKLIEDYDIRRYHIEDDNFSLNERRYKNILEGMIALNAKIQWDTPNSMMASSLNERLLDMTKEAGCCFFYLSIESASPRVLAEIIRKPIDLKKIDILVRHAKTIALPMSAYYVIGFLGETISEIRSTLDLALDYYVNYDVLPYILMATPLPGTRLERQAIMERALLVNPTPADYATGTQLTGRRLMSYEPEHEAQLDRIVSDYLSARDDIQIGKCAPILGSHYNSEE